MMTLKIRMTIVILMVLLVNKEIKLAKVEMQIMSIMMLEQIIQC